MTKVLVTGAAGFVGRALTTALLERGVAVRSFSRGAYPDLEALGVESYRGDLGEARDVAAAVSGCQAVFHVAARFDLWGRYEDFYRTNTLGTRHVIEACRRHGVSRLVYTSTPSVVHGGDSVSGVDECAAYPDRFEAHYPATKALAEQEVLAANGDDLSTVALRPHLVWGPGDTSALPRVIERAKSGRLRLIGKRQQLVDTVYIDNAVAAHLLAWERLEPGAPCAGKAFFVTQDEPVPGAQFLNDMLRAAGMPAVERTVPVWVAQSAARLAESVWRVLGKDSEPPLTRYMVSQLSTAHYYDISAARRDLGYEPTVSYREGMLRLRDWVEEVGGADAVLALGGR